MDADIVENTTQVQWLNGPDDSRWKWIDWNERPRTHWNFPVVMRMSWFSNVYIETLTFQQDPKEMGIDAIQYKIHLRREIIPRQWVHGTKELNVGGEKYTVGVSFWTREHFPEQVQKASKLFFGGMLAVSTVTSIINKLQKDMTASSLRTADSLIRNEAGGTATMTIAADPIYATETYAIQTFRYVSKTGIVIKNHNGYQFETTHAGGINLTKIELNLDGDLTPLKMLNIYVRPTAFECAYTTKAVSLDGSTWSAFYESPTARSPTGLIKIQKSADDTIKATVVIFT
jgi:hypothetical protein